MRQSRISHHLTRLRDARAHLEAALGQALPSDDTVIVDHMRAASAQLLAAIRDLQAERDGARQVAA